MTHYNVKVTNKALADMNAIYDYIATVLQVPATAMNQYNRIADGIQSLERFPERYMLFDSQPEHDLGMRKLLVDNYTAIYVVIKDEVTVLRVLYSSSDIVARLRGE